MLAGMGDFLFRVLYVVICCAGMLGVMLLISFGIDAVPPLFAGGIGVGILLGVTVMYIVGRIDQRNAQRPPKR